MHACWTHKLTKLEEQAITAAKFPVLCIHGRHDIVAEPRFGERLAAQLEATLVMLEGAHFIPRECGHQVLHLCFPLLFFVSSLRSLVLLTLQNKDVVHSSHFLQTCRMSYQCWAALGVSFLCASL